MPALNILPRPGEFARAAFAIQPLAEMEGSGYRLPAGRKVPVAGVVVELVDDQGEVLRRSRTAADGLYILEKVRPGRYVVRASRISLADAEASPVELPVTVAPGSGVVQGADIILADPGRVVNESSCRFGW